MVTAIRRASDAGGLLPSGIFLTPEEMRFRKDADNASALARDMDVRSCPALPDAERVAWHVWFGSWTRFYQTPVPPMWNMPSVLGHAASLQRYESDLAQWRGRLKGDGCKVSGVEPPPPPCSGFVCYVPRGTFTAYTVLALVGGVGLYIAHKKGWLKEVAKLVGAAVLKG
jgi:hypothetical protein